MSGWKQVPRAAQGGGAGLCSVFRQHRAAGLVLHGSPKPARFFAHLFSDLLVLLSQLQLAPDPDASASPRLGSPRALRSSSLAGGASSLVFSCWSRDSPPLPPVPKVGSKERRRVLHRMASEATLAKAAAAGTAGRAPLLFRIEKVFLLAGVTVELQLLNRGFAVDGFEFTVEGPRENLLRWFSALRGCDVGQLVDTAAAAALAAPPPSAGGSAAAEEGSAEEEDLLRMMEEFSVFSGGGSMVVRESAGGEGEGEGVARQVLAASAAPPAAAAAAPAASLMDLFRPPPDVVPVRIRRRTGSVLAGPEAEEEEAAELAALLRGAKWTLRLLRATE